MIHVERKHTAMVWIVSAALALSVFAFVISQGLYQPDDRYVIPLDPTVNNMIALSLVVFLIPTSATSFLNLRFKGAVEKNILPLLRDMLENVKSGLTLSEALEGVSGNDYGPITGHLKKALSKFILGKDFEDVMNEMGESLSHRQALYVANIINMAYNSGERVGDVLSTAIETHSINNKYRMKCRSEMRPYTAFIYIAVLIFLFVSYVILAQFFMPLYTMSEAIILGELLSIDYFKSVFFYSSILEGLSGGLISGKIAHESFSAGLPGSLVLVGASILFFNVLVFPISAGV
ncbi:MAG: type II secretion system F family protein [Candidatus Geothermarchaeales archaeon]